LSTEVKEVAYIAIAAIVTSAVLALVSFLMGIRGDMASIRHNELSASNNIKIYRDFNKYDTKELDIVDIVECVTTYYDNGVEIYVNDINRRNAIYTNIFSSDNYAKNAGEREKYVPDTLDKMLRNDSLCGSAYGYISVLAYNSESIEELYNDIKAEYISKGGHLLGTTAQKVSLIESIIKKPSVVNSEVSGVLIINIQLLDE